MFNWIRARHTWSLGGSDAPGSEEASAHPSGTFTPLPTKSAPPGSPSCWSRGSPGFWMGLRAAFLPDLSVCTALSRGCEGCPAGAWAQPLQRDLPQPNHTRPDPLRPALSDMIACVQSTQHMFEHVCTSRHTHAHTNNHGYSPCSNMCEHICLYTHTCVSTNLQSWIHTYIVCMSAHVCAIHVHVGNTPST